MRLFRPRKTPLHDIGLEFGVQNKQIDKEYHTTGLDE